MTHEERKAKWFQLLDQWRASGLSATAFKKKMGISDSIYKWLAIYRHEKGLGPRTKHPQAVFVQTKPSSLEASSTHQSPQSMETQAAMRTIFVKATPPPLPTLENRLCVEYPSGWCLQFSNATSPDWVTRIANVLF